MITINLRPGQKRKRTGSPFAGVTEQLKGIGARVKDPLLLAAAASWIVVAGVLGFGWLHNTTTLARLEPQLEQVRAEHKRFKGFLQQKKHQELIRDSLLAQIGVIRGVDGDRYIWPHVLDEVARALPAYTWLTAMATISDPDSGASKAAPGAKSAPAGKGKDAKAADSAAAPPPQTVAFQIDGRTVDIQAYTKFLRQLEASPWVTDVTPIAAQTVVEKERPVTAFTLRATFKRADSAYIRTAPLSQSVR
jgi:Tfp pilus assembly protein PilN